MRHFRAAGICGAGLLACRREHRVELRRLMREGVPIDELGAWRDDPFVARAVAAAQAEEAARALA